jgi:hypothetical protein
MNSNLRSMIEDALDGELQDETFSYDSYEDVPSAYGGDEITKLASALNFVATNLDDLGTTDEKLAELELLQEKIAKAETTAAGAAGEAAEDTLGAFYKNLKGGSTVGLGDAFGKLSTGRKFAVGGTAGLVGLGALYGGAKMLGGGGGEQTNVVKVSSLQDAKQRALVKMAEHYNIPVWELEKIATTVRLEQMMSRPTLLGGLQAQVDTSGMADGKMNVTTRRGNVEMTADQISKRNESIAKSRSRIAQEFGALDDKAPQNVKDLYAKLQDPTQKVTNAETGELLNYRRDNPLEANKAKVHTAEHGGKKVTVLPKYQNLSAEEIVRRTQLDPKNKEYIPTTSATAEQQAKFKGIKEEQSASRVKRTGRLNAKSQQQALNAAGDATRAEISAFTNNARSNFNKYLNRNKIRVNSAERTAIFEGLEAHFRGQKLEAEQLRNLEKTLGANWRTQAAQFVENTERTMGQTFREDGTRKRGGSKQPNTKSMQVQQTRKAATEAGEKELGFLAKNRRALLGAGALGAAGLAGYGAYKAFGGGGQSKAASLISEEALNDIRAVGRGAGFGRPTRAERDAMKRTLKKRFTYKKKGMRKLAEDRISPARIRAGKADPFSGMDIHRPGMSRSASPYEPIGIKAQRVRDQINNDMHGYVSHVGGGYNLDRYLNKFNK